MDHISKMQTSKFGGLNDFHTERTHSILEDLYVDFGEDLIEAAGKQSIDLFSLYQWHTERYVGFLENLKNHFGQEIIDKVVENQMKKEEAQGKSYSESSEPSFQKLVDHFSGGCQDRIIEENDEFVIVRTGECYAGRIAHNIGKSELLYPHHCGLDMAFAKGFSPNFKLEILKTIMNGDDCCLHKIWK